jgi:hypothetical protein
MPRNLGDNLMEVTDIAVKVNGYFQKNRKSNKGIQTETQMLAKIRNKVQSEKQENMI